MQEKKIYNNNNYCINNEINLDNKDQNLKINILDKKKLKIFNYNNYKQTYYNIYKNYKFKEPPFIDLKNIINDENNKSMLDNLGKKIGIFFGEDNISEIENGIIFKNLSNFLENPKNKDKIKDNIIYKYKIRKFMIDEMSTKTKTFLLNKITEHINSFDEMKNNEIKKLDIDLINNKIKGDFNFIYLNQYIYSILANESKSKNNNYEIIKKIINEYNEKGEHSKLVKYLYFTVIDYLDMIRYKKIDETKKLKEKLDDFLIDEYINFKDVSKKGKGLEYYINLLYEKNIFNHSENNENKILDYIKKDYICSLLLLTFNLERFFFLRISRGFKKTKI